MNSLWKCLVWVNLFNEILPFCNTCVSAVKLASHNIKIMICLLMIGGFPFLTLKKVSDRDEVDSAKPSILNLFKVITSSMLFNWGFSFPFFDNIEYSFTISYHISTSQLIQFNTFHIYLGFQEGMEMEHLREIVWTKLKAYSQ